MTSTQVLIDAVKRLITSQSIKTQQDILRGLINQGFTVNQSKISRLLRRIGAVKVTNEAGDVFYQIQSALAPPTSNTPIQHLLDDIQYNETHIVIHVSPGAASLIARVLDHHDDRLGILGTVAGDDTIVVIPRSTHKIKETLAQINLLLISGAPR
ncbi:MAG: arginine repressor [Legionellales bacterium]|nr:arginine repressor [Legionellales bacterium]